MERHSLKAQLLKKAMVPLFLVLYAKDANQWNDNPNNRMKL